MATINSSICVNWGVNNTTLETIEDVEDNKNLSESFDSIKGLMDNLNLKD